MRVLHVIPSISSKRGGPSTAIISMVKALRQEGVDAVILTTCDHGVYKEHWPIGHWFVHDTVPILMFSCISSRFRIIQEYLISPRLTYWLIGNIDRFDILHVHSIFSYTTTTTMMLARQKRVPYIVRTIGQLSRWSLTQSRIRKMLMLRLLEKNNLCKSRSIHVTSISEMDDVKLICNHHNILCLHLGVDLARNVHHSTTNTSDLTKFIFLSRIHPKKQLDVLLKAFSVICSNTHKYLWRLYIAGDGDEGYVQRLRSLANDFGIANNIEWMGHISGKDKDNLLRNVDWYVLPSKSENFGLSAVEALSYGVPVIISKEVGIAEAVSRYGAGIVCGTDSASLEEALVHALNLNSDSMRSAAFLLAEETFSWLTIGKKLTSFYQEQLSTNRN